MRKIDEGEEKERRKGMTDEKGEIYAFGGLGETFFVSTRTLRHKERGSVQELEPCSLEILLTLNGVGRRR